MVAQRKLADPASVAPMEDAAPVERAPQADYHSPRAPDGSLPTSPAILLQEQLAARIARSEPVRDTAGVKKWPMPLRIVTIVGLSLGLWAGIVLTAVAVLT